MTDTNEHNSDPNPFGPFVRMADLWMNAWSEVLGRTVASRPFAEAMGRQMDFTLEMTKLLRQQTRTAVEFTLQQMGVPTGEQVVSLAERFTHIEMRLDDIEAKVDEALDALKAVNREQ